LQNTPKKCDKINFIMSPQDWLGLILTALSVVALVAGGIKWLVKHYLSELRPNSGQSLKDQVNRLEERVNLIYNHLLNK
jgi:hypothetical protein